MPKFFNIPALREHTKLNRSTVSRAIKTAEEMKRVKPIRNSGVRGVRLTERDAQWLVNFFWPKLPPIQSENDGRAGE